MASIQREPSPSFPNLAGSHFANELYDSDTCRFSRPPNT